MASFHNDLPGTITPESNASSSAGGDSDNHHSSAFRDSSTEETHSEVGNAKEGGFTPLVTNTEADTVVFEGWESKVISGRLGNLRKAPKSLLAGFRFRAALHHEVVDGLATVKGYKKLEEMVEDTYKGGGLQVALFVLSVPSTSGTRWYYISGREKMMIFTNIRNKWRTPNTYMNYPQLAVGDVDLKNRLLDYVKAKGLVDLEALVTLEQLTLLGFVDVANLYTEAPKRSSSHRSLSLASRPRVEQRVETAPSSSRKRAQDDSDAEDDVPLIQRRTSTRGQAV
ncbi:hypothetical protein SLEP1_g23403 [Rubroshorea leprosula]|uniref:Uncharacterized protein n=1 Tax=Rubroshorea leprosula TaxID=152421 RepID=A0AAV5JL20_9ROSI|nr:hypothetical protein SLEP1_g23403 [Rubroshorea leprosula]